MIQRYSKAVGCLQLGLLGLLASSGGALAADGTRRQDLSVIQVTPHELALTQVLGEICPPMLTGVQRRKFNKVYEQQLQSYMPGLDTRLALQQIASQRQYQAILNSIRVWTLTFPKEENKALCLEIAEIPLQN